MTNTSSVIRAERLTKVFGGVRALDGLDLTVRPGEVHGFLGPNGAGKSTTIRVVAGHMRPPLATSSCLAAIPDTKRPACTASWPMSPATSPFGRDSRGVSASMSSAPARAASTSGVGWTSSSGSTSTPPRGSVTTPKATDRRSRSSPPWPPKPNCWFSTSRPRVSTHSWSRPSSSAFATGATRARQCSCPVTSWARWRR